MARYADRDVTAKRPTDPGEARRLVEPSTIWESEHPDGSPQRHTVDLGLLVTPALDDDVAGDLAEAVAQATEREFEEQDWMRGTADFKEGTKAMGERRPPIFQAR